MTTSPTIAALKAKVDRLEARLAEAAKLPEQWRNASVPDQVYQGLCDAADDLDRVLQGATGSASGVKP